MDKLSPEAKEAADQLAIEIGDKAEQNLMPAIAKARETSAAYREGLSTEAARAQAKAEELLKPTFIPDAKEMFKKYGEPIIGATAGSVGGVVLGDMADSPVLGGTLGLLTGTGGGLIFGRTRAGKAALDRIAKPGNQLALAEALRKFGTTVDGAGWLSGRLGRTVPEVSGGTAATNETLLGIPALRAALEGEGSEQMRADIAGKRK
jgi:hypothetical protein